MNRLHALALATSMLAIEARADVMRLDYGGVIARAGSASGAVAGQRFSGTISYQLDDRNLYLISPTYTYLFHLQP